MFKKPELPIQNEKPQRKKSKIPRLAVALVATVCSIMIENIRQIGPFFAKQSQFL